MEVAKILLLPHLPHTIFKYIISSNLTQIYLASIHLQNCPGLLRTPKFYYGMAEAMVLWNSIDNAQSLEKGADLTFALFTWKTLQKCWIGFLKKKKKKKGVGEKEEKELYAWLTLTD